MFEKLVLKDDKLIMGDKGNVFWGKKGEEEDELEIKFRNEVFEKWVKKNNGENKGNEN